MRSVSGDRAPFGHAKYVCRVDRSGGGRDRDPRRRMGFTPAEGWASGSRGTGDAAPERRHRVRRQRQMGLVELRYRKPEPLVLTCHGPEYDGGLASTAGHFMADLGFEHFFTGHGGLLAPGAASNPFNSSDHPIEHTFRQWMAASANLKQYHAKTRENIQQLFNWVEAIERALRVERSELSSEGEENFEARLDAILAQR